MVYKDGVYPIVRAESASDSQCLIVLGDMHAGSKNFSEEILKKVITYGIVNDAFFIGGGDWIECATRYSVGDGVYEQVMSPDDQIDYCCKLLGDIPTDRWLGAVSGNHEQRASKAVGLDPMRIMCDKLSIKYFGYEFFGILSKQDGCGYTIYATHSTTTGKSAPLEEHAVQRDLYGGFAFDLICKAHGHKVGLSSPTPYLTIDVQNTCVVERARWTLLTGAYLTRRDAYPCLKPMPPTTVGTMAAWLSMRKGDKAINGQLIV